MRTQTLAACREGAIRVAAGKLAHVGAARLEIQDPEADDVGGRGRLAT